MPPLHLRQEFPTLKAFKEALHAWAIEAHFEPRILKSDTGRVRVGCKRDPNCDFVVRCNWERKAGREPLARVTVLRDRHTCVNGLEWRAGAAAAGGGHNVVAGGGGGMVQNGLVGGGGMMGLGGVNGMGGGHGGHHGASGLEIRQDEAGNIVGGARVLGPINPRGGGPVIPSEQQNGGPLIPVLPKVQRNSASRLPFLMEILPRMMTITKETTPVDIRDCLLREYGAEVHLQQCRRAKTEILKKRAEGTDGAGQGHQSGIDNNPQVQQVPSSQAQQQQQQDMRGQNQGQSMDGLGNDANDAHGNIFGGLDGGSGEASHPFQLHPAAAVVPPQMQGRNSTAGLVAGGGTVGEAPVRCPYCVNHRWMKSIKDAVDHMSMHVVV